MIQILNIIFHFHNLINIDDQEAKTKNKELSFRIKNDKNIIVVRKTREIFETKAQIQEVMKSDLGFHETDFLEIFIWKENDYDKNNGMPYQKYLIKIKNIYFDNFSHNFDTISMKFLQDRIDIPIIVSARVLLKSKKSNILSKEKIILKFDKNEKISQKSLDLIHELCNL